MAQILFQDTLHGFAYFKVSGETPLLRRPYEEIQSDGKALFFQDMEGLDQVVGSKDEIQSPQVPLEGSGPGIVTEDVAEKVNIAVGGFLGTVQAKW
jgi:hypothetical protein